MKTLLFIALLALPCLAQAQTLNDYQHAMDKFVKYYNNKEGDSILQMWPAKTAATAGLQHMWNSQSLGLAHAEYGKITAFKFLGVDMDDPNNVKVFTTHFSIAGDKTTSLTLDADRKLGTFRFITTSDGIDKLQKQAANK